MFPLLSNFWFYSTIIHTHQPPFRGRTNEQTNQRKNDNTFSPLANVLCIVVGYIADVIAIVVTFAVIYIDSTKQLFCFRVSRGRFVYWNLKRTLQLEMKLQLVRNEIGGNE